MHLLHLMHDVPLWVTALAVASAAGLYSIGLMLVARALFGVERLKLNNEVAGFKFAVVGVFYGVLLAFVVVSVWEDFHTTEAAVRNEGQGRRRSASPHLCSAGRRRRRDSPAPSQLHRPRAQI